MTRTSQIKNEKNVAIVNDLETELHIRLGICKVQQWVRSARAL